MIDITVGIPTKDRYPTLAITLTAIVMQTYKPKQIIIVDDSDDRQDLREIPNFQYLFQLMNFYKIEYEVIFGMKKGQHFSHQIVQDKAKYDWIFRCDDDNICEPEMLERLVKTANIYKDVGAVAPLILMGEPQYCPKDASNSILNMGAPNIQWFLHRDDRPHLVDHLNSCFLYRKGIAHFNLNLSKVAHREETIFTYDIKLAGYEVMVEPTAKMWHFRQASGGIRSAPNPQLYEADEAIFTSYLLHHKVGQDRHFIILDSGIGDHFAFKTILPALVKEFGNTLVLAVCFPKVFWDHDIQLISIASAKILGLNLDYHNIYRNMIDWNWTGTLVDAYKKLYL